MLNVCIDFFTVNFAHENRLRLTTHEIVQFSASAMTEMEEANDIVLVKSEISFSCLNFVYIGSIFFFLCIVRW